MGAEEPTARKLELVAGEGEGRGAVAVGGVLGQDGQGRNAQLQLAALLGGGGRSTFQLLDHILELLAQEDGHDGRRSFVGAKAMVVAGVGNGGAEKVGVDVHAADDRGQHGQELGVGVRVVAWLEEVLAVIGAHGPVVVLARAVDALEGLLVHEQGQAVLGGQALHHAHDEHVVVGADRGGLVHGGHFELGRSHFVVAGLGGDAQAPELAVEVHHEREDAFANGAEVLVFEFLALGRRSAEQGAAGEEKVGALFGQTTVDQEVFLFRPDVGEHSAWMWCCRTSAGRAGPAFRGLPGNGAAGSCDRGPRPCTIRTRSGS